MEFVNAAAEIIINIIIIIITVRAQHLRAAFAKRMSVRPSFRLSIYLSVTLTHLFCFGPR